MAGTTIVGRGPNFLWVFALIVVLFITLKAITIKKLIHVIYFFFNSHDYFFIKVSAFVYYNPRTNKCKSLKLIKEANFVWLWVTVQEDNDAYEPWGSAVVASHHSLMRGKYYDSLIVHIISSSFDIIAQNFSFRMTNLWKMHRKCDIV